MPQPSIEEKVALLLGNLLLQCARLEAENAQLKEELHQQQPPPPPPPGPGA